MKLLLFLCLLHTCLADDLPEKNSNNWWFVLFVCLCGVVFFIGLTYYLDKQKENSDKQKEEFRKIVVAQKTIPETNLNF
jgi:hypothetical protein